MQPAPRSMFEVTFRSQLLPLDADEYLDDLAVASGRLVGGPLLTVASREPKRLSNYEAHLKFEREAKELRKRELDAATRARAASAATSVKVRNYVAYMEERGYRPSHIKAQLKLMFDGYDPFEEFDIAAAKRHVEAVEARAREAQRVAEEARRRRPSVEQTDRAARLAARRVASDAQIKLNNDYVEDALAKMRAGTWRD